MPTQSFLVRLINNIFYFYGLLIIIRIFLTWINTIDWNEQPFFTMRCITDPYLNIFRRIIPPIGGMLDVSPVVALIVLQLLQGVFNSIL